MAFVIPNNYAPKCVEMADAPNSHGVFYGACNFKCSFCGMANRGDNGEDISDRLRELAASGRNYKFTGGEPTLDPRLPDYLRLAKSFGGVIFLDSNGSRPDVLRPLLEAGLVDVLGLSLKGVTPEEAEVTAGVPRKLCWDRPLESVRVGLESGARTIVTLIVRNGQDAAARLEEFYRLMPEGVYYKINGLMDTRNARDHGLRPMDADTLDAEIRLWVGRHPDVAGRVIFVPGVRAVHDYKEIRFF